MSKFNYLFSRMNNDPNGRKVSQTSTDQLLCGEGGKGNDGSVLPTSSKKIKL